MWQITGPFHLYRVLTPVPLGRYWVIKYDIKLKDTADDLKLKYAVKIFGLFRE